MPAATQNYYIRSLLGEAVYYLPPASLNVSHLAAARLALLQFDVLMLLEEPGLNNLLYEMALGWAEGSREVHARTSVVVRDVGRKGLPSGDDWTALLEANKLDMELYRFGSLLAMLDSIVFDMAKEAGLGAGFTAAGVRGAAAGPAPGTAVAAVAAAFAGGEEQWELAASRGHNGTLGQSSGCGFVSLFDADVPLPHWVVV
jgi:hypothetical protein